MKQTRMPCLKKNSFGAQCSFTHPCPVHDVVVNFSSKPYSVCLPMSIDPKIRQHIDLVIHLAMAESKKYGIDEVILSEVSINEDNTVINGQVVIYRDTDQLLIADYARNRCHN